jgi:hypothetical protein
MSSKFQPKPMSPQNNDTLGQMDKGLLQCGNFASIIQIVCSVLFIIIFGGIGIYMYQKKDNNVEINARITDVTCAQERINTGKRGGTRLQTTCTLTVSYKVDEKDYSGIVTTTEVLHKKDDLIKIKYDKTNPISISYNQASNKKVGLILMGVGCFIILLMIIHIILLKVSDWYKRLLCVQMVAGTVSSAFSPLAMNNYGY